MGFDEFGELGFRMGAVFGVEDAADLIGDSLLEVLGGDVGLGVLLEVELAALPRAGVEGGAQGGTEPDVGVGGDAVGDVAIDADLVVGGGRSWLRSRRWNSYCASGWRWWNVLRGSGAG